MARSIKKPPFVTSDLLQRISKAKKEILEKGFAKPISVKRAECIIPQCIGLKFQIHNGKTYSVIEVKEQMVEHKFGEFVMTRTFKQHSGDRKNDKKR